MCNDCGKQIRREKSSVSTCCQPQCVGDYKNQQSLNERNPCIGDYETHMYEEKNEDICDKGPRKPYQIPGYEGHVPTVQFRLGGTYGQDTHKALASRASQEPISFSKRGHICPTPCHEPYHIPGYQGHVPGLKYRVGGTYGQDTHKLLYSVKSYPNRQENISPYKPGHVSNDFGPGRSAEQNVNKLQFSDKANKLEDSNITAPFGTYQNSQEHYFQPQYKYRIGDTYATTADQTVVDPCVNQERKVLLSTRERDDTQVVRIQETLEDKVEDLPYINQPVRHRPMVPGFDAYVDAMRGSMGQCFEFTDHSPSYLKLQQQLTLQKGKIKEPLRADNTGRKDDQQYNLYNQPNNDNTPYGYTKYGQQQKYTNSTLCDFTSNYRRRQSTEWAPATSSRLDPPAFDVPGEIYTQHSGLLPGYSAHIPGSRFRCGKTFTDDSRDATKAIRGDRF